MAHLIDKSALVAEIERIKKNKESKQDWHFDEFDEGYLSALDDIKTFLDTLEVKEVDLEKEGYITDAKIVRESIKLMNGEKVPMATMDEEPVSEDLEEASKEWLKPQLDKSYANYGEAKMMELTHFDGYAMLDAIEFGAQWQKRQDQSIIELAEDHAMLAGMEKMKEQMMAKAVDGIARPYDNEIWCILDSFNLKAGDKVKVIVIKED